MKYLITTAAIAGLLSLPAMADAQGKGNGNGNGKNHAAQGQGHGNGNGRGNGNGNGNGKKGDKARNGNGHGNGEDRQNQVNIRRGDDAVQGLLRTVTGLTAANGLIYLTPDVDFATITDDDLLSIANCPPGLAKKDPPCVPPGLAKKGVGFDDWAGYDPDALRGLLDDRWTAYDPTIDTQTPTGLTQAQIIDVFDLPAIRDDQRYAVIDGRPVLLGLDDFDRLLTINTLAQTPVRSNDTAIIPGAALTQDQLITRYGLPALAEGQNYALLDNRLITLPDQSYDLLQLIRILGAV